jgi:DNA-binding transcriptional ArsR family regulator
MHTFDVLGDPVRRRILELLAAGEHSSGDIVIAVQREFSITQSAVSQHLRVLRDNGFATARIDGSRRIYPVDPAPLREVDNWLDRFRVFGNRASRPLPRRSRGASARSVVGQFARAKSLQIES